MEREFLPVHEMPPTRDTKPLTEAERKQLETDLKEVRDRQERHAGKPASKAKPEKSGASAQEKNPRRKGGQVRNPPIEAGRSGA